MEEHHSGLLRQYRSRFVQSVEVDRLYPMLVNTKVLSRSETEILDQLPSEEERVGRLLDMLPSKGRLAFESLCLALETTYPHLLTVMFLGSTITHKGSLHSQSTVSSTSTSESDMTEDPRGVPRMSLQDFSDKEGPSESSSLGDPRNHERSYDDLQEPCTMQQAQVLSKEYLGPSSRSQHDVDRYRNGLHHPGATVNELQLLRQELDETKRALHEAIVDRDRLCRDLEELRLIHKEDSEELEKLWRQNKEIVRQPDSSDMLQKMYDTALEKIDDQTKTVRQLRMRNSQLALERDTMGGEVAGCGDQISGLRAQVDTVMSERSTMKGQLVSCQQQYMKVMRELQISHKDCDEAMKREQVLKKIHTEKMMEYNQVLSVKKDLELAVRRSEDQRKEMAAEYSTVMGERDGVLKENNQLQSDADLERKKREEAEHKIWLLQQDLETSKRRLQDNEQELDIAQRDVENLSDCYWDMLTNKKERGKALKDFEKFKEQRDVARKERMEALDQRDMLLLKYYDAEQQQKAMNNERNLANRDVEQMRGQVDQLQRQLKDALQETAKAKHERDWAFNERHKVVQERESIRTLCDQMRKERDLTFKKLTDSLRKVDDMENQRNKSVRDFQEIRDRMQNQSEREARMRQLIAQHSTDSAIDADYLEWESETVELDCRHLISGNDEFAALGFDVAECPDHNCYPEDCSIYVSKVETGSPAHGKLRVNDCLVRINDVDLSASTREGVQQALVNCQDILVMVVKRRRSHACKPITLTLDISRTSLLILENGVFVSGAISGSQSLRELGIMPGDRIFMVNNTPVENMTSHEVQTLLASCQNPVDITVMRLSSFPGTSSGPPSASPTVDSSDSRETPPSCMSSPLMPSPTELSEGAVPSAFKETSVQTDPERKISREMSFRSAHSREDSRESNGGGAEQGTLKAADWEEAKARHQHDQGPLEPPGWGGEMDGRDEYDLGDPGTLKASDWEEAKKTQHHRRGGAHAKQRSRDEQQHHVRSPPKQDSRQQHRRDLSLSGFPPDYSRTQKRRRGPSKRGDHSEKMDYNSTWPKSRGPPDMLSQVKTDLVTVTPLMNPQTYRDPQQDTTAVAPSAVGSPPKPPSRNSSFHIVHHHSSSGSSAGSRRKNSNTSPPSPGAADAALSPVSPRAPVRNVPPVSRESWSPGSSNGYHPPGSNGSGIAKSSKVVPTRKWDSRGGHSPSSDRPVSMPPYLDPQYPFGQTLPRRLGHHPNQSPPGVPGQSPYTQPTSPRGHRPIHFSSNSNPVTVEDYDSFAPRRAHNPPSAPVQTHFVRDRPRVPSFVVTSKQMNPNEPSISGGAPPAGYNTIPHSPSARDSKGQSASSLPGRRWAGRRAESWDRRDPGKDSDSFQVNKSQRIHIPSRTSVSNSSNSLEIGYTSGRSSPTSPSIPEISSDSSHNSLSETGVVVTTQESGRRDEVRRIEIQKSNEQLGFAIAKGAKDGIFVRSVTPNSLAAEGSMCYGDQILEFNGVNLRQATQSQAASIMGRAWNKVNILVQYNPNKMNDEKDEDATSCSTEPNSPRVPKRPQSDLVSVDGTITPPTPRASRIYENLPNDELLAEDIRRIYMKNTNSVLGVTITGGNAVGIFISDIHSESAAAHQSALRVGDQILEYNGVSFKTATAEQATLELQKSAENIRLYVQYNITKYNSIQGLCGDQLYVRCLVDYSSPEEGHLTFKKDNVLFVNNTVYNHELGIWGAHHVNENGKSTIGGIIPSKRSLSQELMLRPSQSEEKLEDGFRKKHGSHGGRRSSFFRRKKGHRGNSRDSRDFGDGSDVTSLDEIPTYQRVKRLDMRMKRPVVILGPHTDRVASKLVDESPDKFKRVPESKRASVQDLDVDMADSVFPDSPQPEGFYECIPTHIIQDICETGSHCLLDGVAPAICKRLNKANMYPIIIFVKFKSSKQIREQKDPHFLREKVTAKQAKDMFERAQQVEQDYRTLFNDTVAGGNLASMCTRVKEVIDREQKRVLWVPSKLPL